MFRTSVRVLLIACFLATPLLSFAAPADLQDEIDEALAFRRQEAAYKVRMLEKSAAMAAQKTPNQDLYDVHHYFLDLGLDPVAQQLSGVVTVSAEVTNASLSTLDLNLNTGMAVSAVTSGGFAATWTHSADMLSVTLDRTYAPGETVNVTVTYAGDPAGDYFGWSSHAGEDMIWTLSEPYGARDWWPCKDLNTDKADSVDIRVTVPDNLVVASNGLVVSDVDNGTTRTTHWSTHYPIATYLVSLAIYPYQTFSTWYTPQAGGSPMEIQHYVYPDQYTDALSAYDVTDEIIGAYAQGYGEYPFINEKYGHATFVWGGGMEHQTLTSMGGLWPDVVSHELAHQWWGDMITCADFHHIWLNEGFATWSEAYWKEQSEGFSTYQAYMDAAAYMGPGTIYVEDVSNFGSIFDSNLSYNKASWVVHMLRGVLGDDAFFAGLAHYRSLYEMSSATTEQFRDAMEASSGQDLHAFFQQWIYGEYFPVYSFGWSQNGGTLDLTIDQVQTNTGLFVMPIQIRVTTDQGVQDVTVQNALASEAYQIPVTGTVAQVSLDPDNWILSQIFSAVTNPTLADGILVVNGVDWNTYGSEITSAYQDSVFWGSHEMAFWDVFAEPAGGYPTNLPAPLGHGSVPAGILGDYSAVVWVGNDYNGDLAKWQETPILSYLNAGGDVLLMTRQLHDHLGVDLSTYLGVTWTVDDNTLAGSLTAMAPGLVDIPQIGTQSWVDAFSTTVGPETTLLFQGSVNGGTQGMGAIVAPAAGGTHRADGGRLAVISGRPYRLDHDALRADVEYILSHDFGEPYTPTTAVAGDGPPTRLSLGVNYPNPFNPETTIPFALTQRGEAEIVIFDAAGRRVRTLLSGIHAAGSANVRWNGRDAAGRAVSSGTYFVRLRSAGEVRVRPLTLVR